MDGKQLYEVHREATLAFYETRLPSWEELSPVEKTEWDYMATEQYERDIEQESEGLAGLDDREVDF